MNIKEVIKKIEELKKAYHDSAKELVAPTLQSLVQGTIKAYNFTCYTPYFNDGEECEFSVNEPRFLLHKDPSTLEEGEEVRINAIDRTGTIVEVLGANVKVELNTGKVITLPVSEITLTGDDAEFDESYSLKGAQKKQADMIESFLESIPADVIKDIFGDHKEVTVYADKIVVEIYEHD